MRTTFLPLLAAAACFACTNNKTADTTADPMVKTASTDAGPAATEFADAKYTDIGRSMLTQMQEGNMEAWVANFADDAVYQWSAGDSLAGKQAIADYWTNRRKNVVQAIRFSNDIWLPIKVNKPQRGPDRPGVWLLGWQQVNVTYKNGKSVTFWTHNDYHFDANNKIDRAIAYIDRAPINAVLGVK